MQSAYHNCPTIGGVMQSAGREFAAGDVSYQDGELRMNIAKAYPKEAGLESWRRTLRLDRAQNEVILRDEYALAKPAGHITLTLMTPCRVTDEGPGKLALSGTVRVLYDAALKPSVEEIKLEDSRLRGTWGERLFRILLRAENPPARAVWTTRVTQAG
jgi:hypothetical protein